MAIAASVLLAISAISAIAAGTAASVSQSRKAQKSARSIEADRQRAAANLRAQVTGEEKREDKTEDVRAEKARQRVRGLRTTGRSGTVLTEPLGGVGGPPRLGRKTLLGS